MQGTKNGKKIQYKGDGRTELKKNRNWNVTLYIDTVAAYSLCQQLGCRMVG
jgi:hypothetical protein